MPNLPNVLPETWRKACLISLLVLWASFPVSPALTSISLGFCAGFWFLWKVKGGWEIRIDRRLLQLLGLFMAWTVLTFFWSESKSASAHGLVKIFQQAVIFIFAADTFRDEKDFSKWRNVMTVVLLVVIADAFFQYAFEKDFLRRFAAEYSGSGVRLKASFKTYGLFACYLISTVPLLFVTARQAFENKKRMKGILLAAASVLGVVLIYLTRSRGAMLAFMAGIFLGLVIYRQFKVLFLLLLLSVLTVAVLPRDVVFHFDVHNKEQSVVERFYLWRRALDVIAAKPLTGTGINTYAVAHQKYDKTQSWRVKNYYAHNGYLQMGAEMGLPGLALFLAFLALLALSVLRGLQTQGPAPAPYEKYVILGFFTAIVNFLVLASGDTVLHNPQPIKTFWFIAGLGHSYMRFIQSRIQAPA